MTDGQPIEFVGIPSGDCECFCWDVDRDTFERFTGAAPDEFDQSRSPEPYRYRLYPGRLVPTRYGEKRPVRVTMTVTPLPHDGTTA